jgi:hypothetical protein
LSVLGNIELLKWHAAHLKYYQKSSSIGWARFATDYCFDSSYQLSPFCMP